MARGLKVNRRQQRGGSRPIYTLFTEIAKDVAARAHLKDRGSPDEVFSMCTSKCLMALLYYLLYSVIIVIGTIRLRSTAVSWPGRAFRAVRPRLRVWLAVGLLATTVMAGGTGLTRRLLDYVAKTYGAAARSRLIEWQKVMDAGKNETELAKLSAVNSFFNKLKFVDDIVHWKKQDYWATPVEMLATDGGDCEDFAIGKFFTLKEMGVPEDRMLITYVKSLRLNQAHMVLTYYPTPNADPLVLDNLTNEIKHASERADLAPVYSFNGKDLWLSKERGRGKRIGSSNRISLWNDLNERIEKEQLR